MYIDERARICTAKPHYTVLRSPTGRGKSYFSTEVTILPGLTLYYGEFFGTYDHSSEVGVNRGSTVHALVLNYS